MAAPTPQATCYRALCNDPDKNPLGRGTAFENQVRQIYGSLDTQGTLTPAEIVDQILMDMEGGMIGGLLMFRKTDPDDDASEVETVVLHNLKRAM